MKEHYKGFFLRFLLLPLLFDDLGYVVSSVTLVVSSLPFLIMMFYIYTNSLNVVGWLYL